LKKNITYYLITILIIILTAGCSADVAWLEECDTAQSALSNRAGLNINVVEDFVKCGLLSEDEAQGIIQALEAVRDNPGTISDQINEAITWYLKTTVNEGVGTWKTKTTYHPSFPKDAETGDGGMDIDPSGVKAIEFVGANQYEIWNRIMSYKICVLNPQPGAPVDVSEIRELLQKAKGEKGEETDKALSSLITSRYFINTGLALFDPTSPENALIKETEPITEYSTYEVYDDAGDYAGTVEAKSKIEELGKDFILSYDGVPVVTLRIKEFNPTAVKKLLSAEGIAKDKFLVDTKNLRIFLLEYPVYALDQISTQGENSYSTTFKETELTLNILTGEIKRKTGEILGQNEPFIDTVPNNNSFVVYGESEMPNIGYEEVQIKYGMVILKDYLEMTYMPGVIENEDYTALGRRIRIENFEGDSQTVFGRYIGKSGAVITNTPEIFAKDLIDIKSAETGKAIKLNIEGGTNNDIDDNTNNDINDNTNNDIDDSTDDGSTSGGGISGDNELDTGLLQGSKLSKRLLDVEYKESINPTTSFPGDIICTKNDGGLGIVMYGLAVDLSPFESGLYSGWIVKDDTEDGGLLWWNRFLNGRPYNYNYKIDPEVLKKFFTGNYSFDVAQLDNIVVLDLNTIAKIQEFYDKKDDAHRINTFRTAFAALGIILIAYSVILAASWVVDVNLFAGLKLMNILTLGKWEAISNNSELPQVETRGVNYITFPKTVMYSMFILCLGGLLLIVDIIDIIKNLILIFGGIGEWVTSVIFGMN